MVEATRPGLYHEFHSAQHWSCVPLNGGWVEVGHGGRDVTPSGFIVVLATTICPLSNLVAVAVTPPAVTKPNAMGEGEAERQAGVVVKLLEVMLRVLEGRRDEEEHGGRLATPGG